MDERLEQELREEQQHQQHQHLHYPQRTKSKKNFNGGETSDLYPVTECCNSDYTRQSYKNSFDRFLKHIKVYDLQVLWNFGDKALEQLIIKYVIHARDEKKLSRASIEAELHIPLL